MPEAFLGALQADGYTGYDAFARNPENTIRPVAPGRKNYLFAGSHKAARNAAMIYSFPGTCKLNDVEPFEWLSDVLTRLPDYPVNRLEEQLPNNWEPGGND